MPARAVVLHVPCTAAQPTHHRRFLPRLAYRSNVAYSAACVTQRPDGLRGCTRGHQMPCASFKGVATVRAERAELITITHDGVTVSADF